MFPELPKSLFLWCVGIAIKYLAGRVISIPNNEKNELES